MKLASGFWQGVAAASSLLLAGGYVAYSAGILRLSNGESPPAEVTNVASSDNLTMFSSSKMRALVPAIEQWNEQTVIAEPAADAQPASWKELTKLPQEVTDPPPPALIGGSKSVVLIPAPSSPTDTVQSDESESILVGSKSPAVRPLISPPPANPSKAPTKQQSVQKR